MPDTEISYSSAVSFRARNRAHKCLRLQWFERVWKLRFLYQSLFVIVVSAVIGVGLAFWFTLYQTSNVRTPFSQCRDYPYNATLSSLSSCQPLAPFLILLAVALLVVVIIQVARQVRKRKPSGSV
jgi:ABC-type antimicrobial peptide transport system permease subunit